MVPLSEPSPRQVQTRQAACEFFEGFRELIFPDFEGKQVEIRDVILVVELDAILKLLDGFFEVSDLGVEESAIG